MKKQIFVILVMFTLLSCDHEDRLQTIAPTISDSSSAVNLVSLSGKVYSYAPDLDTLTGVVVGACDCCSGDFLFLNDSDFVSMDYCEARIFYSKGKYHFEAGNMVLVSDGIFVEQYFDPVHEANPNENTPSEFSLTKTLISPFKKTFKKFFVKNKIAFLFTDEQIYYLTHNEKASVDQFVREMKQDGIFDSLNSGNYSDDSAIQEAGKKWIKETIESFFNDEKKFSKGFSSFCTPEYTAFKMDATNVMYYGGLTEAQFKAKWGRRYSKYAGVGEGFMIGSNDFGKIEVTQCGFKNKTEMGSYLYDVLVTDKVFKSKFKRQILLVKQRNSFLIDNVLEISNEFSK